MKLNGPSFAKLGFAEVEKLHRDYQETVESYRKHETKKRYRGSENDQKKIQRYGSYTGPTGL